MTVRIGAKIGANEETKMSHLTISVKYKWVCVYLGNGLTLLIINDAFSWCFLCKL